jgi:hypothetical protein
MPPIRVIESWFEGIVRVVLGAGLIWVGVVELGRYGLVFDIAGVMFILAGVGEIWFIESAARRLPRETIRRGIAYRSPR